MTDFERNEIQCEISLLKQQLADSDYKCLKHSDGALTDEEYEPVRKMREELRRKINELEGGEEA